LLGNKPIDEITPAQLLYAISAIENEGFIGKANRTLEVCSWIFKYAIKKQLCLKSTEKLNSKSL